ncbi:MAG: tetrapyrrole methylase [Candidatus Aminicenantes bacterium]|nr:MAG: tetrapyrrole methylase [Candidatus Aminicenantes bacterium]
MSTQQKADSPSERGLFYVIGTGPAGPQMATLQALDTIQRMDGIAASKEHVELFSDYLKNKPILFDPWEGLFEYKGKFFRELSREDMVEFMKERIRKINERVGLIKSLLMEGKNVGLLDSGNPTLFAPGHWYVEKFEPENVVIIPGMGSDAAAMAALGKSVIPAHDTRFVVQTSPVYLMSPMMGGSQMLKDISKYPTTMVLYNALGNLEQVFTALGTVYPSDMPCAVVYWAGYQEKQKIVRGTVADIVSKLTREKEKYMGLILIGRFLDGKPYEGAMNRPKLKKERTSHDK